MKRILTYWLLLCAFVMAQPELTNTEATNIDTAAERLAWQQAIGTDYELKTSGFTAEANGRYVVNGTTTVTDPSTPTEGTSFFVFVQGGSVTVGGTAYTVAGTGVYRIYASAAWANYVSQPFAGYAANNTWNGTNTFNSSVILGADITAGAGAWDGASFTGPQAFESVTMSGDLTVDTTTLKVDSTNNRVGVGTASPDQVFVVTGSAGTLKMGGPGVTNNVPLEIHPIAANSGRALIIKRRDTDATDAMTVDIGSGSAVTFGGSNGTYTFLSSNTNTALMSGGNLSLYNSLTFTANSGTWNGTTFGGAQSFTSTVGVSGVLTATGGIDYGSGFLTYRESGGGLTHTWDNLLGTQLVWDTTGLRFGDATGSRLDINGNVVTIGNSAQYGQLKVADGSANYGTISMAAHSADRTYTIPDAGGAADFAMTAGAQTLDSKTLTNSPSIGATGNITASAANSLVKASSSSGEIAIGSVNSFGNHAAMWFAEPNGTVSAYSLAAGNTLIYKDSTDLTFNVPTGDGIEFMRNGVMIFELNSGSDALVIPSGILQVGSNTWSGSTFTGTQSFSSNVSVTGNLTIDTNAFYVDATQDFVGLGTTTPVSGVRFLVNGAISRFNGNTAYLDIDSPTVNEMRLNVGAIDKLLFATNGVERMRMTNGGVFQFATNSTLSFNASGNTYDGATFTGAQSFSNQVELTGQAASGDDSAMTRSLVDTDRWLNSARVWSPNYTFSYSNSGTGSISAVIAGEAMANLESGTSNSGYGKVLLARGLNNTPGYSGSGILFSKPVGVSVNMAVVVAGTATNTIRLVVGTGSGAPAAADSDAIADDGFGIEIRYDGTNTEWRVFAHNGTTFTASAWTDLYAGAGVLQPQTFAVYSDGAGNITGYRGTYGADTFTTISTTGGPTTTGAFDTPYASIETVNASTGTDSTKARAYSVKFFTPDN